MSAQHPCALPPDGRKVGLLWSDRMLDRLHKDGSVWVYPIRQIVSHIVLVAVDDETDGGTNAIALIVEQGRQLEDVEVVVRRGDSKISMPYPQPVVSYSFKDHRGMLGFEARS